MTSALAISREAAPVDLDPRLWIIASEAAEKLGEHRDNLTRRCRQLHQKQGLAVFAAMPGSTTPAWFIARRHDPRLALGKPGEDAQPSNLDHLTADQRRLAYARLGCVDRYTKARQDWRSNQAVWLPRLVAELRNEFPDVAVSGRSLQRWYRKYDGKPANLIKLADARGGNQRGEPDPAAWAFFTTMYMQGRQWELAECWRRVREEAKAQGWKWCSLTSCRRLVTKKISRQEEAIARDPRGFRSTLRSTLKQNPERFAAGDCWIGDNVQLDLICYVVGPTGVQYARPWLTAWMDWRTRRIMGWHLALKPNSTTILAALRKGLLDPKLITMPSHVWIDNGKDFDCWLFHGQTKRQRQLARHFRAEVDKPTVDGLLNRIGIKAHFSIPHNPNGKSRLERWFGYCLHKKFDKMKPTYTGSSEATRPEYLNRLIAEKAAIPSFDEIRDGLELHIEGFNASSEHRKRDMAGLSPDQYLARHVKVRRLPADREALDAMLVKHHKPVTMTKDGVALLIDGRAYLFGQFAPALQRFKAKRKEDRSPLNVLYDPDDLSSVRVFDASMRFICAAPANQLYGNPTDDKVGEEHLKEAHRLKRQAERGQADYYRNAQHTYQSTFEIAAQLARDERRAQESGGPEGPTPDAPIVPVRTPLDGQAIPEKLRKAAGAEGRSLPSWSELADRVNQSARSPRQAPPLNTNALDRMAWGHGGQDGRELSSPSDLMAQLNQTERLAELSQGDDADHDDDSPSPWSTFRIEGLDESEAKS